MINIRLKAKILRLIKQYHARVGVLAALFFILLATSGIALNHTTAFHLNKKSVNYSWLMHWYGLKQSIPDAAYPVEGGYFATWDNRWIMNQRLLKSDEAQPVIGALTWGEVNAIATQDTLYLYTKQGQLVDKITTDTLPTQAIEQLGVLSNTLVIKTASATLTTEDGLTWYPLNTASTHSKKAHLAKVHWANKQALPSDETAYLQKMLGPSLPLERVLLDLHSGRIFGRYGVYLMDFAAILLMLLSVSGVWVYWQSAHK